MMTAAWGNPQDANAPTYAYDGSTWSNDFSGTWHFTDVVAGSFVDSSPSTNHALGNGAAVDTSVGLARCAVVRGRAVARAVHTRAVPRACEAVDATTYTRGLRAVDAAPAIVAHAHGVDRAAAVVGASVWAHATLAPPAFPSRLTRTAGGAVRVSLTAPAPRAAVFAAAELALMPRIGW